MALVQAGQLHTALASIVPRPVLHHGTSLFVSRPREKRVRIMCVADRDRRTETPNIDPCSILCKAVHCEKGLAGSSFYNYTCYVVIPLLVMTLLPRLVAMLPLLPPQARDADLIPYSMTFVCAASLRESLHTSSWKPSS